MVDTCNLSDAYSVWYSPDAVFHDTTTAVYIGGERIWTWIQGLFSPFSKIHHQGEEFCVITKPDGTFVVYSSFLSHFYFKGDPVPAIIPRFFVFTLGASKTEDGCDGLQIREVRLYWDTALIGAHLKRRASERAQQSTEQNVVKSD
jgi:hypothetical protein